MTIDYQKILPVKYDVDIFVAGGGPAGIAAAVTAARKGKRVFLAEAAGAFGGAASQSLVPAFMPFTDGEHFLAGGFGKEVRDYLIDNCPENFKPYCPDSIPVELLKLFYDQVVADAGVQFCFFTGVIDAVIEDGWVKYAVCNGKSETYAVRAKAFIDCTGDGDFAALAGAGYQKGGVDGKMMAATLCGLWAGIDWENVQGSNTQALDKAFANKVFTNEDRHLPGMWRIATGIGGSNAGHVYDIDGSDAASLTEGMVKGRRQMQEYRQYYKEYLMGFENMELVITAPQIGIRETRRIDCDYRLCVDDFISRANFYDEIGRFSYPIDIHAAENTKQGYDGFMKAYTALRYNKGENYGIPYRCMTVKGFGNLLVAGRCVCTDREMEASIRVMPGCFITGQAAGMAAALASEKGGDIRTFEITALQKSLKELGAYLPNCGT